jgi:hypothetical protein
VTGDNYAKVWPVERFRDHGITYEACDKVKSVLYQEFLPLLNSARVVLLDNQRLITQLCNLERHTGPSGRDTITHPPGGHDDLANALAGALVGVGAAPWWKKGPAQNYSPAPLPVMPDVRKLFAELEDEEAASHG